MVCCLDFLVFVVVAATTGLSDVVVCLSMIACAAGFVTDAAAVCLESEGEGEEGPSRPVVTACMVVYIHEEPTRILADQGSVVRIGGLVMEQM